MARFPFLPMAAIMMTLVTDSVVQQNVVAYAGFMVEYLGVVDDRDKAGYYAGFFSTAFMIGRLLSSHAWGLVSDRYGCRFVMAFGLCANAALSVAFGLSPTFAWAIALRFLGGFLVGSFVACKTIVSEVCGKEHDTVGMGVVTAAFSMGQMLGSGFGGMLSEPAIHHPGTFSESGIFGMYPYLLPNVVVAGMALVSLPLVFLFLEAPQLDKSETPSSCLYIWSWCRRGGGDAGGKTDGASPTKTTSELPPVVVEADDTRVPSWMQVESSTPATGSKNGSGPDAKSLERNAGDAKPKSLLRQQHIRMLLLIDFIYSLTYTGLEAVFTLWTLSTVAKGGLDWSAKEIGQVFFACGMMLLVFVLVGLPFLTQRFGVRLCQRLGSVVEVPMYFIIPLLSNINSTGLLLQALAAVLLFLDLAASDPFYIGISLAINNATGPDRRGEINGILNTTTSVARSISTATASALFAYSIDGNHPFPFDYHLAFYYLALIRLTVACLGWNRICDNGSVGKDKLVFGE